MLPQRNSSIRSRNSIFFIFSETEKTEKYYLKSLVDYYNAHHEARAFVMLEYQHCQNSQGCVAAVSKENTEVGDQFWVIFDKDDNRNFINHTKQANELDIALAVSNPCFETWLLLHFKGDEVPKKTKETINLLNSRVTEHIGTSYKKHGKVFDFIKVMDKVDKAERRANNLFEASRGDLNVAPITTFHNLTKAIRLAAL